MGVLMVHAFIQDVAIILAVVIPIGVTVKPILTIKVGILELGVMEDVNMIQ
jgi:hypothetical protein